MENINKNDTHNMNEDTASFKYNRRSRSSDNRNADDRSVTDRPPIVFSRVSQFELGDAVNGDRDRFQFGWVPYIVANDEVEKNYYDALRAGWEPASASEYPQLLRTYKNPFKKREEDSDFIKVGGQICMKRSLEVKESEEKYYDEENYHKGKLVENHLSHGTQIMSQTRNRSLLPRGISFNN